MSEKVQPPTLTKTSMSDLIDFTFVVSWNRVEGVSLSIVTIVYELGSIDANAKLILYQHRQPFGHLILLYVRADG